MELQGAIGQKHLQLMHKATDIAWSYFVKELNKVLQNKKINLVYLYLWDNYRIHKK